MRDGRQAGGWSRLKEVARRYGVMVEPDMEIEARG